MVLIEVSRSGVTSLARCPLSDCKDAHALGPLTLSDRNYGLACSNDAMLKDAGKAMACEYINHIIIRCKKYIKRRALHQAPYPDRSPL